MKRSIITKDGKKYIQVSSKWENFTDFCARIKTEIGETLFKVCDPIQEEGAFYVHIPIENKNRLTGAIQNFCGTEISPALFSYHN